MSIIMVELIDNHRYESSCGHVMQREPGHWVLRGPNGEYIDTDQYRHDLAERHNLKLDKKK